MTRAIRSILARLFRHDVWHFHRGRMRIWTGSEWKFREMTPDEAADSDWWDAIR